MIGMLIVNTQTTSHIDVVQSDTHVVQRLQALVDTVAQRHKIICIKNLRADMKMQTA